MKFHWWSHASGPMDCRSWASGAFAAHSHRHHRDTWGRHGGDDPRRSRSRMFEQGDLRFVLLKLLAEKPAHGYELIKAVEHQFGGGYSPSPGIVYPTLTLLEDQGLIEIVESVGSRKLYGLTDAGRAELERVVRDVDRVFSKMHEYRQRYGGGPAPEIMRAMENLKAALHLRLDRGELDDVSSITSILDKAARAIEEA